MYELSNDGFYAIYRERAVIADCLADIGLQDLSRKAINPSTTDELINKFLSIITSTATTQKRHDVLEKLCFAGLIYA